MENEARQRDHGALVHYDPIKHFGFIFPDYAPRDEDNKPRDVFMHLTECEGIAEAELVGGLRLTFEIDLSRNGKGFRAHKVKKEENRQWPR